jgi:hypothetical protein
VVGYLLQPGEALQGRIPSTARRGFTREDTFYSQEKLYKVGYLLQPGEALQGRIPSTAKRNSTR